MADGRCSTACETEPELPLSGKAWISSSLFSLLSLLLLLLLLPPTVPTRLLDTRKDRHPQDFPQPQTPLGSPQQMMMLNHTSGTSLAYCRTMWNHGDIVMCYEHHISRRPCAGKAGLRVPFRSLLEPGRYPLTTLLCTPPTAVSKALRLPRLTAYYCSGIISADVRIMMLEVVMMSLARPGRRDEEATGRQPTLPR